MHDRAVGTLLGVACGDALGRPVEFHSAEEIRSEHGRVTEFLPGSNGGDPGAVTDDTELTLALARSLRERGGIDAEDIAERFATWYRNGPTDIGYLTRDVIREFVSGRPWRTASYSVYKRRPNGREAGNGSLMRTAPVGIAFANDAEALMNASRVSSAVTHFDHRCQWACVALNRIIASYLRGVDPDLDALANDLSRRAPTELVRCVRTARSSEPSPSGYVLDTLAAALHDGLAADDFETGLVRAVNRGGDADTVGAVTGSVLGARFGAEAIPDRWRSTVQYREELTDLAVALRAAAPEGAPLPSALDQR